MDFTTSGEGSSRGGSPRRTSTTPTSFDLPSDYGVVTEPGGTVLRLPCWQYLMLFYLRRLREAGVKEVLGEQDTAVNAWKVARHLTAGGGRPWLLISGNCGSGKTTMLRALQRLFAEVLRSEAVRGPLGVDPEATRPGLCVITSKDLAGTATSRDSARLWRWCEEPLLGIDDVGCEAAEGQRYANVVTPFTDLLACRYERRLLTIMTTNLSARQLGQRYGTRAADRMREMAEVVYFTNDSFRGGGKGGKTPVKAPNLHSDAFSGRGRYNLPQGEKKPLRTQVSGESEP